MIGKEVADLIADKGRVTKEIFFTIYYTLTIAPKHEMYDNDFIVIFAYNSTIIMMGEILNNPHFYISGGEMRLKDDIYYLQQELGDIKQESFAMEMLKYSKKQNKILFVIILILLVFWFATGSYLIWVLNNIGVEEITTEESYGVQQEADGNNNYINGSENSVNRRI